MAKLPSAQNVVQSYLAWIPVSAELMLLPAKEERWGWRFNEAQEVVMGKVRTMRREVLVDPARLISDFTNTASDSEGVLRFTRKYGVLQRNEMEYQREIDDIAGDHFCVRCPRWLDQQRDFRDQWVCQDKAATEAAKTFARRIDPVLGSGQSVRAFVVPGKNRTFELELRPSDLLGALWLALLGHSGRTRKCQNPTCFAPYFIPSRRDQKYCNEVCSRLAANRRWWAANGTQWREKRSRNRKGGIVE
jgi:hypothetical protein